MTVDMTEFHLDDWKAAKRGMRKATKLVEELEYQLVGRKAMMTERQRAAQKEYLTADW